MICRTENYKEKPLVHGDPDSLYILNIKTPCSDPELSRHNSRKDKTPHLSNFCGTSLITYDLPRDFMYFFALRSPILEAFFFTASVGRPSFAAILAVALSGKSFLSRFNSLFDHKPLMSFFFVFFFLRLSRRSFFAEA